MTDADLPAILKAMRDRAGFEAACTAEPIGTRSCDDVTLLVMAIEDVLKPHQPGRVTILGALCKHHENHRHFSITSTEADGVRACPDCTATVYNSCTGCGPQVNVDACPVRTVITRALAAARTPA